MPRSLCSALLLLTVQCVGSHARAQQSEQITVTGPASSAAAAVSTSSLSATDIQRSGVSSLGSLLDQVPAFGAQGVNNAQNDGGYGEYFIDLRNLNFDRTVVLIDGKRFPLSGIQTDEAVDLNTIPLAFIDHVEVLRDGSQPQYAPDAVAGAVNVVLKDQIDGIHLDTYGAATGVPDGGTGGVTLTGGQSFATGHVAAGLDFYQRDPVNQASRAWSADPIAAALPGETLFGSAATAGGHAIGPGIDSVVLAGGRTRAYNPLTDFYNAAPERDLQGGLQRETAYFDADAELTDSSSADVELLYSDRRATTLDPPQTLGLTSTSKNPAGFTIPAADPFNPYGAPVTLERVVTEAGPQATTTSGPVWRVLGGLSGAAAGWDWSLGFDHGQSLSHYSTSNAINLTRALQTAGNGACPAGSGCVEAGWFGPASLSPAAVAYISYVSRRQSAYTETNGVLHAGRTLFDAPGGAVRLSLGADLRAQTGATSVDAITARGDQAGPDAAPTRGAYDSYDGYATLKAPMLRHRPGADRLDLSVSARFTSTSRYGSFPTLRAMLDYAPIPGLTFRAVSGTARRPPAISEAFGGITAAAQPVTDPCAAASGWRANATVNANCLAQGLGANFTQASPLINVLSGGNPHLRPEQSENEELGVVATPPLLPFLTASLDYYHYRIRHAIDSLADTDPNLIPDVCYASAHLSSPFCALLTRTRGGGNAGQISAILGLDENIGTIKTDGLEFGTTLHLPETRFGTPHFDWQTNWLLDYRIHDQGQPGFTQYAGTFPGLAAVGEYASIRARATAGLDYGDWSFGWTGRYLSGARVLGAASGARYSTAPDIFYQDLQVTRRLQQLTLMAGIDNLADLRPPTLVDGVTNTDTSTYDVLGRVVWGRVSYVF